MFLGNIGVAFFTVAIAAVLKGEEPKLWWFLLALFGALIWDVDLFIWQRTNKKLKMSHKWDHRHRDYLHHPAFHLPALLFLSLGWMEYAFLLHLVALASLLHFAVDTVEIGWGIRWLYLPLFNKGYKRYFCLKHLPHEDIGRLFKIGPVGFFAWTREQQDRMVELHGQDNWIKSKVSWFLDGLLFGLGLLALTMSYEWCNCIF